jgi:hypothetical protein
MNSDGQALIFAPETLKQPGCGSEATVVLNEGAALLQDGRGHEWNGGGRARAEGAEKAQVGSGPLPHVAVMLEHLVGLWLLRVNEGAGSVAA